MYIFEFVRGTTDQETRMDYFDPGDGKDHLRYVGIAKQGTPTSSQSWNIKRLEYTHIVDWQITRIQVLDGAWDDRATLPWL